jgi:anti-sigma B factor antagonist
MSLQISIRKQEDFTILDLHGKIALGASTDSLSSHLQDSIAEGARKVLLIMAGVTQMDTSGISTIVRAFVSMERQGGKLALVSLAERQRMLFEMTRLLNIIPSFRSEPEALASLR